MSETNFCRDRLAPFCTGNGLDIGFGGDPIVSHAITIDRREGHPLRRVDDSPKPTNIAVEDEEAIWTLPWFANDSFDFVFSSHVLEDAEETKLALIHWCRVIKPGGKLVLFLPDEQIYRKHCRETGQPQNLEHKHENFGLEYVTEKLSGIRFALMKDFKVLRAECPAGNPYSFDLVVQLEKKLSI